MFPLRMTELHYEPLQYSQLLLCKWKFFFNNHNNPEFQIRFTATATILEAHLWVSSFSISLFVKKKKNSSFDSGFPCETLKSLANSGQSPNSSVLVSTYSFIFEKRNPRGRSFFCWRIQWLFRTTHRAETIQMWVLQHPVSCFSLDYFGIPSYQVTRKILYCFYLWELLVFYLWELLCTGNIFLRNGEERKH